MGKVPVGVEKHTWSSSENGRHDWKVLLLKKSEIKAAHVAVTLEL